ncbi:MAG: FtsQ-type POTRA domain-containing protein [Clostridia bacterium]|nr:FtsQ-type POTRA domain-containing protein [Clostridia bacterium]MBQ9598351.1 FtsQ-type POTRA domain-containing protein [Clostridia bacterium]
MAKKHRKSNRKKAFVIILIIVAIIVAGMTAPFFNIKTITVSGVSKLTEEEVISQSEIKVGGNIFRTNIHRAENRLEKIPYIKEAKIYRKFPNIVKIKIVESELAAYIKSEQGFVGVDINGKVLEISDNNDAGTMTLTGLDIGANHQTGENIKDFSGVAKDCMEKLAECEILSLVADINIENTSNIIITTREGLEAHLGNTDELDYKIKLLQNVISQGYTSGIFDATNTSQPTFRKNK